MNVDLIVSRRTGGRIYQGNIMSALQAAGVFHLLVICAQEQPETCPIDEKIYRRSGTRILFAPNNDNGEPPTREQLHIASKAAGEVARAFLKDEHVLVTCMQGRNRSGLVTALALCSIYGVPGRKAVETVRRMRKGAPALTNDEFVKFLHTVPAVPRTLIATARAMDRSDAASRTAASRTDNT